VGSTPTELFEASWTNWCEEGEYGEEACLIEVSKKSYRDYAHTYFDRENRRVIHTNMDLFHMRAAQIFGARAPRWNCYTIIGEKRVPAGPSRWIFYEKDPKRQEQVLRAPTPLPERLPWVGVREILPNHGLPSGHGLLDLDNAGVTDDAMSLGSDEADKSSDQLPMSKIAKRSASPAVGSTQKRLRQDFPTSWALGTHFIVNDSPSVLPTKQKKSGRRGKNRRRGRRSGRRIQEHKYKKQIDEESDEGGLLHHRPVEVSE